MPYSNTDDEFRAQAALLGTTALAMVAIVVIAVTFLIQEDSPATVPLIGLAAMTVVLHVIILVILGRSRLRRVWLALNPPQVVVRPVEEMVGNPSCDCSICLQPLLEVQKDEMLLQLPCSHAFHSSCIKDWVENQKRCPLCRGAVESVVDCKVFAITSQRHAEDAQPVPPSQECDRISEEFENEVVFV
mmetsp:Transcript_51281/g.120257  ORF Transcript_51281/g.120257 Transcript_51281/m.120257 type:complete len:188 (+) Transcript_51281:41-604(+)